MLEHSVAEADPPRKRRPRSEVDHRAIGRPMSAESIEAAVFRAADHIRASHRAVWEAREVAAQLGDTSRSWRLLARAARVESNACNVEEGLDALMILEEGGW